MNRPTLKPSQEASKRSSPSCQVPSWEGLGVSSMHAKNRKRTFHEPSEAPPGFGLRQCSGALAMEASQPKAPEDWRSPKRYRAIRRFTVPMHSRKRKEAFHEPCIGAVPAARCGGVPPPERTPGGTPGELAGEDA